MSLVSQHTLLIHVGLLPADSCFSQFSLGTYAGKSLYLPSEECVSIDYSLLEGGIFADIPYGTMELIWVNEVSLDESILADMKPAEPWAYMDEQLARIEKDFQRDFTTTQHVLDENWSEFATVLYRTPTSSLYSLRSIQSSQFALDKTLSPIHKASVIPYPPEFVIPVPTKDIDRVLRLLDNVKYNVTIARLVNGISLSQLHEDLTWLTGEARGSPIQSRHSFHPHAIIAAHWILEQIESTGAACELRNFLTGFAPNIICRYNAIEKTESIVLLSAHYDSRGSFGSTRAPGGDDDGSGIASILSIARRIGDARIRFKSNVELCLFAGEEQGLRGSDAYARQLRAENASIVVMIQADMLAYHKPGEPRQLGLPDLIGTPEVAELVAKLATLYSPELLVGFTLACCSDHQSFHNQGFAATQVFERAGPIVDPMYHNSGDLSNRVGYDLEQLKGIAKVQFATLLHAAGFEAPY